MAAIPVALATVAACGSLVTSIKSSWELKRMIKRKQEARECEEEAPYIFRRLRRAYYEGLMDAPAYEHWYERFLMAKVEKDSQLRRIRAYLRLLEKEKGSLAAQGQRSRGGERERGRRREDSVSYAGSPPPFVDEPRSRASLEYHPDRHARVGARPDQFMRLDRGQTYGEAWSDTSSRRGSSRSTSVRPRHESRGRPTRRYDSYDSDDESSDYYTDRRQFRGRSLNR